MVQELLTRQPERTVPGRASRRLGYWSELVRVEASQILSQTLRDEDQTKTVAQKKKKMEKEEIANCRKWGNGIVQHLISERRYFGSRFMTVLKERMIIHRALTIMVLFRYDNHHVNIHIKI